MSLQVPLSLPEAWSLPQSFVCSHMLLGCPWHMQDQCYAGCFASCQERSLDSDLQLKRLCIDAHVPYEIW